MGGRAGDEAADTLLLTHHRQDEQEHRMQSNLPFHGWSGDARTSGKAAR